VYGQHWGGPEGDLFGRAARKFERMGVGALLINCLPVSHVSGILPWLRDFTDMPLGIYPNLGHYLDPGWKFDESIEPDDYAQLALQWREEGAQIIGGCCGVTPEHIAAAGQALANTKAGKSSDREQPHLLADILETRQTPYIPEQWADEQSRLLYPLPFPQIVCVPDVFSPTQGSFLMWKHLFRAAVGKNKSCLDVGCGTGILTVQLALNEASHVHAIDIQPEAVANMLANAFRNGVADRVSGAALDLYAYLPDEKYDVVVASLYQMPVDPMGEISGHRPVDYWGRNMLDHLITLLPNLLEADGVAYLMQISILSQLRSLTLFEEGGLDSKVIDFAFFRFNSTFYENIEQIQRVEQLSDAYHLKFGDEEVMVMYLLEVRHR
jgi:SAM-dependent methyltransferase